MKSYLDSSVIAAWLLKESEGVPERKIINESISSELIRLEIARALHRRFATDRLTPDDLSSLFQIAEVWMEQIEVVPLFPAVLQRASGSFPTVIGSLDAIHLATALLWQEDTGERLTFLTHDRQLRTAAQACGFSTSALTA
jgi:uncharacterized protein